MDEALKYIKRSKYRTDVLKSLNGYPQMPSEIAQYTKITPHHVSHTLKELKDDGLVLCINPKVSKGRIYKLTQKGEKIVKML